MIGSGATNSCMLRTLDLLVCRCYHDLMTLHLIHPGTGELVAIDHVTSDHHFFHTNIISYCDRPYNSIAHMNSDLVARWNAVVAPDDVVLHLGDVFLGRDLESIHALLQLLNGELLLLGGNHDEISSLFSAAKQEAFTPVYEEHFELLPEEGVQLVVDAGTDRELALLASHYPYLAVDDHRARRRLDRLRPTDEGLPLLHGHTHSYHVHENGWRMFHVGVDAHDFTPVSAATIVEWRRSIEV